jgi:hypothetical protein
VSAAFYSLAEALEMMRRESGTAEPQPQTGDNTASAETTDDLLTTMIQNLLNGAEAPPREVEGVSEEFCDGKSPTITSRQPAGRPATSHSTKATPRDQVNMG